jgi:CubicO group peptidase (beta-lactamase class C family)
LVLVLVAAVIVVFAAVALAWQPWYTARSFRAPASVGELTGRLGRRVPDAMHDARVPGAAIAVVHGGRLVWARGFGTTRAGGALVTTRTRFQVGSLSKPVTAWGAVTLAERGILPLDAPLTGVLHPWPLPPSREDADGITTRRILSHTAGLSVDGYLGTRPPTPAGSTLASLRGQGGEGPATAVRLVARPGGHYRYSGGGYTLLQAAIEQRTGMNFAAWARRDVLAPLGMPDSVFGALPRIGASVATGHDAHGRPVPDYRYAELAAAGLTSSARDMGRFAAAILRQPDRLAIPQPATDGGYGLGVHVARLDDGVERVSHEGVNRGWYARLLAYPDRGWAVVVLTNGDGGRTVADAVESELEG